MQALDVGVTGVQKLMSYFQFPLKNIPTPPKLSDLDSSLSVPT
jgi:hypothetical protein